MALYFLSVRNFSAHVHMAVYVNFVLQVMVLGYFFSVRNFSEHVHMAVYVNFALQVLLKPRELTSMTKTR